MSHPENRFIFSLHRRLRPFKLSKQLYYAKLQVSGNNGWPDCYYSGTHGDLWAEYKWVGALPKREDTGIAVKLSPNQRSWLDGRHKEGRQVCVIIGSPQGHLILQHPFPESISRADFIRNAVDASAVLEYIQEKTLEYPQKDLANGCSTNHST